ncbi:NUDIX hydrolase [Aureimonas psammosilenae]|uniref:NUDIX hydrolase n=1 Tax=Aureimonas psammosilenae TaxID=2495496 RepID=UPI00186A1CE6|nr:NUDIX hydrolase [Aureimonas psammosilenae]
MPAAKKSRHDYQVAALPLRLSPDGRPELLLVTSRQTQRWIVPKGWTMKGVKDHRAAATEAFEEAGIEGTMLREPVGCYTYWRRTSHDFRLTTVVAYAMRVERTLAKWKEKGQREMRWAGLLQAADLVAEPELSTLIARLPLDRQVMSLIAPEPGGSSQRG